MGRKLIIHAKCQYISTENGSAVLESVSAYPGNDGVPKPLVIALGFPIAENLEVGKAYKITVEEDILWSNAVSNRK